MRTFTVQQVIINLTRAVSRSAVINENRFMTILNDDDSAELKRTMDVNFMGAVYCTRSAYKSMMKRSAYGYIININSIDGHYVSEIWCQELINIDWKRCGYGEQLLRNAFANYQLHHYRVKVVVDFMIYTFRCHCQLTSLYPTTPTHLPRLFYSHESTI